MKNIIIRNVKKEDIPGVVDVQITGWQTAYKGIIDDSFLASMNREERIKQRNKDYNKGGFIVAELNKEIVGFCRFTDSNTFSPETPKVDCELLGLYVKPNLKNNGIDLYDIFKYHTNYNDSLEEYITSHDSKNVYTYENEGFVYKKK